MENNSALKEWLNNAYLNWQLINGISSQAKFAQFLGIGYTYLNNLMNGRQGSVTMQTAYQIGERLNDFSILGILGYPVPDAPLVGLPPTERAAILDWLESVKLALDAVPESERMVKLKQILDGLPDADTEVD